MKTTHLNRSGASISRRQASTRPRRAFQDP